jgi:hypothetical protein
VGMDSIVGRILAGVDVFLEITMSQYLGFGCKLRYVSGVQKILVYFFNFMCQLQQSFA